MQLARVIYDTPPSANESAIEKLRRKFGEWWIAPVIYAELTRGGDQTKLKEWTANHLWLAQRAGGASLHGVELTARVVFGKEAQDLTTAEQYVLASAVNKPIILQEGSEQLNKVRLDHWRYITEVRAKKCADKLLADGDDQKKVVFELINMAGGPPDPVMRPKLQAALEEYVPQAAKQAMANPVLRANVLVPDVRYGVREEMKNEFGYNWRQNVREVNLTLDVIENRTFREKVRGELSRLNAKLTPKLDNAYTLDLTQLAREPGTATKRTPDIILVAANEKGEIVRYFEANDIASYFGSPTARNHETGKYEPEREGRRIASVAKMLAAIGVANEGRDGPETLYTDTDAPEAGLETCRKGSGTLTRGRTAKVAFACSHNKPIQWRLEQLGQEPVRKLVSGFGLTMPRAAPNGEMTPATTAVARGLIAASPQTRASDGQRHPGLPDRQPFSPRRPADPDPPLGFERNAERATRIHLRHRHRQISLRPHSSRARQRPCSRHCCKRRSATRPAAPITAHSSRSPTGAPRRAAISSCTSPRPARTCPRIATPRSGSGSPVGCSSPAAPPTPMSFWLAPAIHASPGPAACMPPISRHSPRFSCRSWRSMPRAASRPRPRRPPRPNLPPFRWPLHVRRLPSSLARRLRNRARSRPALQATAHKSGSPSRCSHHGHARSLRRHQPRNR